MSYYYVDPAATGDNDGGGDGVDPSDPTQAANWTNAWTSIHTAFSTVAAGDTVYMRGTETLSADAAVGTSGSLSNWIKFIGCNASGVVDGTRYVIDSNNGSYTGFGASGIDWIWVENVEVKRQNGKWGFNFYSSDYSVLINCIAHDGTAQGFDVVAGNRGLLLGCQAYNSRHGFEVQGTHAYKVIGCVAHDNTQHGFKIGGEQTLAGCLAYSNGDSNYCIASSNVSLLLNCVSDDASDHGVFCDRGEVVLIGCRVTNNGSDGTGYGVEVNAGEFALAGWSFFSGNQDGVSNGAYYTLPYRDDSDTNETSGTEGYVDRASGDYNLTSAATLRSVAIEID